MKICIVNVICVRLIHKHICGVDKRVCCGIDNRRIFCEIDRNIFCAIIVKPFCGVGYFENWEKQEISYWLRDRGLIYYICVDIIQTSWHGKSMFVSEFCFRCNFLRVGQFLLLTASSCNCVLSIVTSVQFGDVDVLGITRIATGNQVTEVGSC